MLATIGDIERVQRLASLSKPMAAWAILVAVEEGVVSLDQPVGQPGCTLRHLLAHAGGYPFEGEEAIARPEATGSTPTAASSLAARAVEDVTDMTFADYLDEAVFVPLGMTASVLRGSAAHGVRSNLADTCRFVAEVMRPTLIDAARRPPMPTHPLSLARRYRSRRGPLRTVPLGAGFRGSRRQAAALDRHDAIHRARSVTSAVRARCSGSIPTVDLALVALADRDFDEWTDDALAAWPALSDAVLAEFASPSAAGRRDVTTFSHGDRIRYATTGDDGLPLVRYGFVGGVTGPDGPLVVMLDGELGGDVVEPEHVEPVHICNVTLTLAGSDLLDDPSLRQGLVNLWAAEAESAGLQIASLHNIGTGVRDFE